jgi:NAD(P)-dependent dehydrogenase (short-subunit alcohol dehydrogenase family)
MATKIALITGANKGVGFHIARDLAERGHTVLVGARSPERGEAAAERLRADGHDAVFVELDVTEPSTIDMVVKRVEEAYGRLDILVNNAGIALAFGGGDTSELTLEVTRKVFETNVFGVVTVTNAFMPLLRAAAAARIVNVSSEIGSLATVQMPGTMIASMQPGAYGASKAALNMLTVSYAKELAGTPIKINAVTPGYTATDLNANQGHRTPTEGARIAVEMALLDADGPHGAFRGDEAGVPWVAEDGTIPW